MVEFSKQVADLPVVAAAYDDPFFSTPPTAIEDSAAADRQGHRRAPTRTSSRPVPNKADVNDIVLKAIESALFNNVAAQQALDRRRRRRPTS